MRMGVNRQAEQLEQLLEGRLSPDEADRELRNLASLATTVHEEQPGPAIDLTDAARDSMRARLMADLAELEAPASQRAAAAARPYARRASRSAKTALASGLASMMIGTTGVAMAAQEALPGDALYNVKKSTESVRMTLAGDSAQAGRLDLQFAEERLEEVIAGVGRQPNHVLVAGLAEMDQRSLSGSERLVELGERRGEDELLLEVDRFIERQSETLVDTFGRLPVEVRPYVEDSLSVLHRIRGELLAPVAAACDCEGGTADELCDCGADRVRGVASDPLPRLEPEDSTDDAATERVQRSGNGAETESGDAGTDGRDHRSRPGSRTIDSGDLVPRLPGALDEVGRTVNDTVGDVLDTTDKVVRDTTEGVGEVLEETERTLRDTTDKVGDSVKETTEGVGDLRGQSTEAESGDDTSSQDARDVESVLGDD